MPELPEVETLRRSLHRHLQKQKITGLMVPQPVVLQYPTEEKVWAETLIGAKYQGAGRRGKYLFLQWQTQTRGKFVLIAHLRMSGRLLVTPSQGELLPHTHVRFQLSGGQELRYQDVRRFGRLALVPLPVLGSLVQEAELPGQGRQEPGSEKNPSTLGDAAEVNRVRQSLSPGLWQLGPEPFSPSFTVQHLVEIMHRRRAAVKGLLLDQRLIAGLGNIYADEALFRAQIHPAQPGGQLTAADLALLHEQIVAVLAQAIASRGTTLNDYRDADNEPGEMGRRLQVYGREGQPCRRCQREIEKIRVAGRGTHFCPHCQGPHADHLS